MWECAFCVVYVRWCCVEYFVGEYVVVVVNDCLCVYSFHVEFYCFCCGVLWCCVYVVRVVVVVLECCLFHVSWVRCLCSEVM